MIIVSKLFLEVQLFAYNASNYTPQKLSVSQSKRVIL